MANLKLTESELSKLLYESMAQTFLNEAFNSNQLRGWFKQHGGVKNRYNEPEYNFLKDKRVRQDSLGDVSDDAIVSMKEFGDIKQAENYCWEMNHPKPKYGYGRMAFNQNILYTIYRANDGNCLVVGLDKNRVETRPTWGGEMSKKTADRKWANDWNPKTRSDRYVDDKDTYYYNSPANDFGVHTNHNYQGKLNDKEQLRQLRGDELDKEWREKDYKNMHDYLNRYYPKVEKHFQKK